MANQPKLVELHAACQPKLAELHVACQTKLAELHVACQPKLAELHVACQPKLAELHVACQPKLAELHAACQPKLAELHVACQTKLAELHAACQTKLAELHVACQTKLAELHAACQTKLAERAKSGAKGGTRTPTALRPPDPKSGASASSATFAWRSPNTPRYHCADIPSISAPACLTVRARRLRLRQPCSPAPGPHGPHRQFLGHHAARRPMVGLAAV